MTVTPLSETHPALHYINETFDKGFMYEEGMVVYLGRVLVNAEGSYVSIDLGDMARLGLTVKSIEIENDEYVYSSVYHSFFQELIIVWTVESRVKSNTFSLHCIITGSTVGSQWN